MTAQDAIAKLRQMQSQIVHGSNVFGDIADCIVALQADASRGAELYEAAQGVAEVWKGPSQPDSLELWTAIDELCNAMKTTPELERLKDIGDYDRAQEIERIKADNAHLRSLLHEDSMAERLQIAIAALYEIANYEGPQRCDDAPRSIAWGAIKDIERNFPKADQTI